MNTSAITDIIVFLKPTKNRSKMLFPEKNCSVIKINVNILILEITFSTQKLKMW